MAVLTAQRIKDFYDRFKSIDVVYTKEMASAMGLDARQIFVKCVTDVFPCIIHTSSFEHVKIILNIKTGILEKLQRANNALALRYCFKHFDTGQQVTFFVQARVAGYVPYNGQDDMYIFDLQFAQQPPDDLIEIVGRVLDANVNSQKRKDERISITPESCRKLRLLNKETVVQIDNVPRRCILRDISFSGVKIVMVGVAKFIVDKNAVVRLDFDDPPQNFEIKGKFVRAEAIEGRSDLVSLGINFEEHTPMPYKMRLSDYLNSVKSTPSA